MTRLRMPRFTAPPAEVTAALDALRQRYEVPQGFSAAAQTEAQEAVRSWQADGAARFLDAGARDARDLPLVTIDPPGSRDLDQALLIERFNGAPAPAAPKAQAATDPRPGARPLPVGTTYRVSYAIASLGTFVSPGGALDAELHVRGETIYTPDRSTALHPEVLSHGAASLLPDQDTPACLWTIDLDADGAVLSAHVERALVRSRARLDYQQVQDAIDGVAPLPPAAPADLPRLLEAVGQARQAQEAARGGISLRLPEQDVEEVPEAPGAPSGYRLVFRATRPAEEYNAQVSLLTGVCAAQMMLQAGVGVLRTMPPAPYAHVTAPLRRLVDRYGLEICLAVCAGQAVPEWVLAALPTLPATMATTGRRANAVERGALDAIETLVLSRSVGQVFEGVITSARGPQGELVLADPAVVSTVVAQDRERLPVGGTVRARLVQADPARGVSRFRLLRA